MIGVFYFFFLHAKHSTKIPFEKAYKFSLIHLRNFSGNARACIQSVFTTVLYYLVDDLRDDQSARTIRSPQLHSFNDHSLSLSLHLVLLLLLLPSSGTLFLLTLDLQTVSLVLNVDWNLSFLRLLTPPRTVQCHRSAALWFVFLCDLSRFYKLF